MYICTYIHVQNILRRVRSKTVALAQVFFSQITRQRIFNINRRSLNRDALSPRGKSMPKLQQLQLYGNTIAAKRIGDRRRLNYNKYNYTETRLY